VETDHATLLAMVESTTSINNVGWWAKIHLLPMVPMENIAFAVRTWPVYGGSAGALGEKKGGGNRPRHALGHGRIYNQSNNVGCSAKIHLLQMVPMEKIAFAVRTWPVHGGSAGALGGKKGGGYRPRHALGHGRIYNQSNNVGCWTNIHLLPMVPMENIAFAVRTWPVHGGSARGSGEKKGGWIPTTPRSWPWSNLQPVK
jgi:hypothetical protein